MIYSVKVDEKDNIIAYKKSNKLPNDYEKIDEKQFQQINLPSKIQRDEKGKIKNIVNIIIEKKENRNLNEILRLKGQLDATDYQAIKYAEGQISEEEYSPIREERQAWRDRINELERMINEEFTEVE